MNNKPESISIQIEKPIYGGDFLGRMPDNKPIFIPFVLPNETVKVKVTQEKKGYARGSLQEVIDKSNKRIIPPCKYFSLCGGCHYQHMGYQGQLDMKQQVVIEQLARLPGFTEDLVSPIIPSPKQFQYRNNVQFSVNDQGKLGFQAHYSNQIVPVDDCLLLGEQITHAWKMLDLEQFPGLKRIHIREGIHDEIMIILESDDFQELPVLELDVPVSVVHLSDAGKIVLAGDDHLIYQIKNQYFHVSAESFFQINTSQAEKMVDLVTNSLNIKGGKLLELFSGVGLFTRFLAEKFDEVIAVEESPSACGDFAINLDEYDHINLYQGKVSEIVPQLKIQPDIILVDPPRSGIDPITMESILSFEPERIIYISCDLSTLSRDLKKILSKNYRLVQVQPVDMFPQTFHIETIVFLEQIASS